MARELGWREVDEERDRRDAEEVGARGQLKDGRGEHAHDARLPRGAVVRDIQATSKCSTASVTATLKSHMT